EDDPAGPRLEPGALRALLRQKDQGIVDRLAGPRVEHDGVLGADAVPIAARAVDGIDAQHPLALLGESSEVARALLGLDPALSNGGPHVAESGDQDFLHREVGERERIGRRVSRILSGEGDVVAPELTRESPGPAEDPRQLRGDERDQLVHLALATGAARARFTRD